MAAVGNLGSVSPLLSSDAHNSTELQDLAQFSVDQHNSAQSLNLKFIRLVSARQQVVAGTMHHLTLEAELPGQDKQLYEAKVWVKPWQNFKKLEAFTAVPSAN